MAKQMEVIQNEDRKKGENSILNKKKKMYSKSGLLPEDILAQIPYRETYNALKNEDSEALSKLLSAFVKVSMTAAYRRFEHIEA